MRSGSDGVEPASHVPLAPITTLRVGGAARWFVRATTPEHIAAAHAWCRERGVDLFTMGGGSNLVVSDAGYGGLVLQIALGGTTWSEGDETCLLARAGEPWDRIVSLSIARGLVGIECLSGIPGSVGGTPIQNVGAYGQEVADVIDSVTVFDRRTAGLASISKAQCGFSYRTSRFKRGDRGQLIVCEVVFRLRSGRPTVTYPDVEAQLFRAGVRTPGVEDVRSAVLAIRARKGMVLDAADQDTWSVGSFFTNPIVGPKVYEEVAAAQPDGHVPGFLQPDGRVKIPAAWLIERAGFHKGYALGRAALSTKHPLAIVNRGGATARDVLALAVRIKRQVADHCGIVLQAEPVFVGLEDDLDATYLQTARAGHEQ